MTELEEEVCSFISKHFFKNENVFVSAFIKDNILTISNFVYAKKKASTKRIVKEWKDKVTSFFPFKLKSIEHAVSETCINIKVIFLDAELTLSEDYTDIILGLKRLEDAND